MCGHLLLDLLYYRDAIRMKTNHNFVRFENLHSTTTTKRNKMKIGQEITLDDGSNQLKQFCYYVVMR